MKYPMKPKFALTLFLVLTLFIPPLRAEEALPPLPEGPLLLTSATPEMLSADYWIHRLENPDRPLKTPAQIKRLHKSLRSVLPTQVDIFAMEPRRRGRDIRDQIQLEYDAVKGRILFDDKGGRIPASLFANDIRPLMQWEKVPQSITIRWGVATQSASVRALPTDVKMLEEIGDIEFDQLQYTLIKLWTPVGIYHTSSDGKWYYLEAPYVRGWVKAEDIALFATREELKKYADFDSGAVDFYVVTGESVPLFVDEGLRRKFQLPSMGTMIPIAGKAGGLDLVWTPSRGADGRALLRKRYLAPGSDVSTGFLPYTQGNVIRQAFKLLGARYGWGGMYHGRDCSAFVQDVFLTTGIAMPRNSKDQVFIGTQIDYFPALGGDRGRRTRAIRSGTPAVTLMTLSLHQMLYLGEVEGRFYAIHSTWAERISMTSDEKVRINQVVVSDLELNGNSYLGALFDRIISVNEIL